MASAAATPRSTPCARLPVDVLQLDRGLVEGMVESARLHKITSGLLRIACDLGMQSVADGVDLPEQASPCAPWDARTGRAWPSPGRWTSTGCAGLCSGHYPVRTARAAAARGGRCRGRVTPCIAARQSRSRTLVRRSARIMRRPSHRLDTSLRAGGRVRCHAHPNSRTWTARRLKRGHRQLRSRTSPTRSPRLPHGTRGFLLHRRHVHTPAQIPAQTLSFEKRMPMTEQATGAHHPQPRPRNGGPHVRPRRARHGRAVPHPFSRGGRAPTPYSASPAVRSSPRTTR